jgi:hypothetical protein
MTPPFTRPFSTLANFQDLCDYLREEGVAHQPDAAAQVAEVPTSGGFTMYLRWELALPLVQIVHLAVTEIPVERMAAVAHTIGLLNHAAPLAGFALDPERRFAYFRITVLRDEQDQVAVPHFNQALRAAVASVRDYLPLLLAAANAPQPADAGAEVAADNGSAAAAAEPPAGEVTEATPA